MCLIALALGASARFPFVIAANRDEFLERPTQALAHWQTNAGTAVLSGRDERDGGIWMGFSPSGRFAMLTNVRQVQAAPPAQPISRGALALAWLDGVGDVHSFAAQLQPERYSGFNLIVGDVRNQQCHHLTNQAFFKPFDGIALTEYSQSAIDLIVNQMPWGAIYGLSNATLDTPWPKTVRLKQALQSSLNCADAPSLLTDNLAALQTTEAIADDQLPQTGVPLELERALSSVWVSHPADAPRYGTRSSLVAVQTAHQHLDVTELTYSHQATAPQRRQETLDWR